MKKILLIGANSALAKAVAPVLAQDSAIVTAGRSGCDVYCDITEPFAFAESYDVVINFAAVFGGQENADILEAEATNVLGTLNICMAAEKAGVKHVINISSLSAVLPEASPYYTIYAITKRHGDELAEFYCKSHDIPLTIIRPSQIYASNNSFASHQPLFHRMVSQARLGEDIAIYGKHDAWRNFIHADDIAEVIRRVVAEGVAGTYACAYPEDTRLSDVARIAQRVFGKGGEIRFLDDKQDIPDNIFAKDTSLFDMIKYHPVIDIEEGIRKMRQHEERV
jgi:nucleoside-diphosphate-sugar epimerase